MRVKTNQRAIGPTAPPARTVTANVWNMTANFELGVRCYPATHWNKPPRLIDNTRILALAPATVNCKPIVPR
jgi:hypothetical protein